LLVVLLKYPDIYTSFIYQWLTTMPVLTVFVFLVITMAAIKFILDSRSASSFSIMVATIIAMIVFIGAAKATYYTPRYTFFIYPLFLLLFCASVKYFSDFLFNRNRHRNLFYSAVIILFVFPAEDFEIHHLVNINTAEINFRQSYPAKRAELYYQRDDYRTPAEYINRHREEGDMIISTLSALPFYLEHLDYRFLDYRRVEFSAQSACRGDKALWSNADLIYRDGDLFRIIDDRPGPVWLAMSAHEAFRLNQRIERAYQAKAVYRNLDETIVVYRISAKNLSSP
jgi:hypothetical protein